MDATGGRAADGGRTEQVAVALTAQCNLRCSYCYQDARLRRRMSWRTLRASIDLLLSSSRPDLEIVFLGGEPLLEFDLMRRGVQYATDRLPAHKTLGTTVLTNGTLVTDAVAEFLADAGVAMHLSFDGVRSAQDERCPGTFDRVDGLLDRLSDAWPDFLRRRLTVVFTLTPGNLPHLAESVDYLLGRDVGRIAVGPVITPAPGWRQEGTDELDRQLSRVAQIARSHFQTTGRTPFALGGGTPARTGTARRGDSGTAMCGIAGHDALMVDVGGEAYACAAFAESYQRHATALMKEAARAARLGHITALSPGAQPAARPAVDPDPRDHSDRRAVAALPVFAHKERKRSGYRRCADCAHLEACRVCPAAIGRGGRDPDRIPDFLCAYNMTTLEHARSFPVAPSPRDRIRSGPARRLPVESDRTRSTGRQPSQRQARDA